MTRHKKTYVFCQVQQKMVEKGTEYRETCDAPMVMGPMKPFVSPITGEEITNREQLRIHNRQHGVTNSADYSPEFLRKRTEERHREQERQGREHRIKLLKGAVYGERR